MSFSSLLLLAGMVGGSLPRETGGFVRGHIFVAIEEPEPCVQGGQEWIIEIDPDTGDWSIFADSDNDGLCFVSGLRFTPDGSRLLAANGGSWIQAFASDGSSEIILGYSDGINAPVGANCLAFDRGGDLYVLNSGNSSILRFPRSGGAATVFADHSDGITGRGALEFSPSGDLFYSGALAPAVIRINPDGQASVFDAQSGFITLAFDDRENLFSARLTHVFRYDGPGPNPTTRRLLADGFESCCGETAITWSADARTLYFAEAHGRLYAINPDTGAPRLIADFREMSSLSVSPTGATVYAPDPDLIPGRCCFGAGSPLQGCTDGVIRPQCGDDEPGPFVFTPKASCPPVGPPCVGACCDTLSSDCEDFVFEGDCAGEHQNWNGGVTCDEIGCVADTGACCDPDPFVPCTDATVLSACQCITCTWHKLQTCAEIECPATSIPTTSAWGLAVLTLLLMIGAKTTFPGAPGIIAMAHAFPAICTSPAGLV